MAESSRRRVRPGRIVQAAVLSLIMSFIALPLLVVVWTAVQPDTYPELPPRGVSLRWWPEALTAQWLEPIWQSLLIAIPAAALATCLGTAAAYGLLRSGGVARTLVEGFLASPLLLPEIVISLALLQMLTQLGGRDLVGTPILMASHVLVGIPFVVRTVGVALAGVDPSWERAAADLGATRARTFLHVTLPLIRSGILAGMLFSFIASFNNVELSLFLVSREKSTIPIAILSAMQYDYSPVLACVALLTLVPVLLAVGLAHRYAKLTDFIYGGDRR
ncbi:MULTISPECIES: ABC transporter permease [Actinomadura]|uniref:ABC transporter permease n=1 Tax=Actinomadura TaxID=1988 RepID=UPI000D8623C1|nr:ABC transporter permease [Actinomadura madurae]SPT60260.1 Inner membrane ABC transporter permease protein ydcV [Actinomadura madurae]